MSTSCEKADQFLQNLVVPKVIAKNECIYCFEHPFNDRHSSSIDSHLHSVNVCLNCFQAVCERHVPLHVKVSKGSCDSIHTSYLEMAKVRKISPQNTNESSKKLKLQVVEKSEDETYDTLWKIREYNVDTNEFTNICDNTSNSLSEAAIGKINMIFHSKSQELVDQTKVWELEVKECEHTVNYDHFHEPDKKKIDQCSSCELNSNLWLCLHCGNIGCGREQVGINGNSHALTHYSNNQDHPLAVKLGSLSKTSNDLFCYKCNDEVKFGDTETFIRIVKQYGIDLSHKMASEKTLIELQVEQNLNWDFKMTDSKGNELKKLKSGKKFGCGLLNLGNSCYLNSVLQILINGGVEGWSLQSLGSEFPLDVVYPCHNLKCQLIKLYNATVIEPERYPDGIKPTTFKNCVGQLHDEFSTNRQQDAMEFFSYIVEELDKKIFKNDTKNPNDLLRFNIEEKLQCTNCKKIKFTTQVNEAIQLPMEDNDDEQQLVDNMESYFAREEIEFTCESCHKSGTAIKKPGFKTYPTNLIINPIRIKLQNWIPIKTSNSLEMPGLGNDDKLDVSKFKADTFDPLNDELMESEDQQFVPNESIMSQIMEMGFTRNAAIKALFNSGSGDIEAATNWLFQHVEDADLNDDFVQPSKDENNVVDTEALNNMVSMGLDSKLCKKALILNHGNVNSSVEWVFNNLDDDGHMPEKADNAQNKTYGHEDATLYKLNAVICHKGNSVHSGHYVAFIKKQVDNADTWVLYNDEKIVIVDNLDELKNNGYLYVYSRITN